MARRLLCFRPERLLPVPCSCEQRLQPIQVQCAGDEFCPDNEAGGAANAEIFREGSIAIDRGLPFELRDIGLEYFIVVGVLSI